GLAAQIAQRNGHQRVILTALPFPRHRKTSRPIQRLERAHHRNGAAVRHVHDDLVASAHARLEHRYFAGHALWSDPGLELLMRQPRIEHPRWGGIEDTFYD